VTTLNTPLGIPASVAKRAIIWLSVNRDFFIDKPSLHPEDSIFTLSQIWGSLRFNENYPKQPPLAKIRLYKDFLDFFETLPEPRWITIELE
jgi:hypothetical protein